MVEAWSGETGVMFHRRSAGLASELDVEVRCRDEPRIIPNLWYGKTAAGGTTCKTKREDC